MNYQIIRTKKHIHIRIVELLLFLYLGDNYSKVASGGLDGFSSHLGEISDLILRETDLDPTVDNGNRRRGGAVVANDLLDCDSSFEIVGVGHSVRDNGALECNQGLLLVEGGLHFVREAERRQGRQGSMGGEGGRGGQGCPSNKRRDRCLTERAGRNAQH